MAKNGDPANIGHADYKSGNQYEGLVNTYVEKMKLANRLKYKNPELRLQAYNGLGIITPSTDQNFHGYKMQSIYGVPIPKGGLNMKQNPLYGKQIIDIKDNVLKKNSRFVELLNEYYPEQTIKRQIGGILKAQEGDQLKQRISQYNTPFPSKRKELEYNKWVLQQMKERGRDIRMDKSDYDIQGFFLGNNSVDKRGHGTDEFKKP